MTPRPGDTVELLRALPGDDLAAGQQGVIEEIDSETGRFGVAFEGEANWRGHDAVIVWLEASDFKIAWRKT